MPVGLHTSGSSCSPGADRAAAVLADLANAGRLRWGLKGVDRIVNPNGAVQSSVVEAAKGRASPRGRGRRRGSGGSRGRLPHAASVGRGELRRSAPREKPLDASHENVEGRSGVSLPEVGGSKPADEAINAETAHFFVEASQPITTRHGWMTWPCSSVVKT